MDEIAEKGYAAHFKYKHGNEKESGLENWLNKLKETLENPDVNAVDFVEQFKLNLYAKEIYIFTPQGDIKSLPKSSTPLDFAFAIHTDVGMTCRGAKVNGKLVPLSHTLNSGDQVQIITSNSQKPKLSWLDFAQTARAKSKIKAALKEDQKMVANEGKEVLARKLRHLKIPFNESSINELVSYFKLKTSHDLFYRFGNGAIDNQQLKNFVSQRSNAIYNFFKNTIKRSDKRPNENKTDELTDKFDLLVFGKDEEKLVYNLAQCCNPIPGDKVFGFVTVSEGIKVHKQNCPNAISLQSQFAYRVITAKWIDSTQQEHKVQLKLTGIDHMGLVNEVTQVISSNMNVNIYNINISGGQSVFTGQITVGIKNNDQLRKLIEKIKKIDGIDKIQRLNS
ncbi:UNVERIFIED_CONTAM: hypothetical protein GTU68_046681 [Idotea baltica]|nr:hypothetical protein [Idotea baltica]